MFDLKTAKKLLLTENLTLFIYDEKEIIKSSKRGVAPLLELIDRGKTLSNFTAVDKVVGSAASYLYCILGVKSVYALVISKNAKTLLNDFGITVYYDTLTDYIINRKGNGACPMECAVKDCKTPFEALEKIKEKLKELNS